MMQFISWAIIKRSTESVLPRRGIKAHFRGSLAALVTIQAIVVGIRPQLDWGLQVNTQLHYTLAASVCLVC